MKRALVMAAFALAVSIGLGRASAQAVAPELAPAIEGQDSAHQDPARQDRARNDAEAKRLYADGKVEYAQGRYREALLLFERAYALSEAPGLLFNMAQAHRLAGNDHCPQAVALYKSYLAALPDAENLREVQERLLELGECKSPSVATAPAPSLPVRATAPALRPLPGASEATKTSAGPPKGALLVTGVGAALLLAGGALYAVSYAKHREATRVCPCYPGTYAKWEALTNVSYATLAVGGATLLGGVSWWVVGTPASRIAPAQAMLGVQGRF